MTARFLAAYETPAHPEAFDRHYREVRIPLCRQLPELRRYTVSRGAAAVRGTPDYLAAELEWDTVDELRAAFASPQGRATAEDAARLQELPSVRSMIFAADDSMILSRRPRSRGHADTISTETGLHVSLDQGAVPFLQAHSVDVDGEFATLGSGGYRPMRVPVPNVITGDSQVPVSWGAWRRRTSGAPRSVTSPSRGTAHTGCMQEARATSTPGRRPGHARLPGRQSTIRGGRVGDLPDR
jgi:uncharacterized protein (TIGR02118 family)